jgi:multiple sugar transport system permease protein
MMMPLQVTLLPNYIGLRDLNLLDTRLAIILPAIFNPFALFIIYQYMKGMHTEYIEAARLETSSILLILAKIVVPYLKTCVIAVFIFIFSENWNMVEQPIIYIEREELYPLSVQLNVIISEELNVGLAGAVIFMLPVLLIYLFFSESFEKGLEHLSLENMKS